MSRVPLTNDEKVGALNPGVVPLEIVDSVREARRRHHKSEYQGAILDLWMIVQGKIMEGCRKRCGQDFSGTDPKTNIESLRAWGVAAMVCSRMHLMRDMRNPAVYTEEAFKERSDEMFEHMAGILERLYCRGPGKGKACAHCETWSNEAGCIYQDNWVPEFPERFALKGDLREATQGFVGRKDVLAWLDEFVRNPEEAEPVGGAAMVIARGGMGKSWLVLEYLHRLNKRNGAGRAGGEDRVDGAVYVEFPEPDAHQVITLRQVADLFGQMIGGSAGERIARILDSNDSEEAKCAQILELTQGRRFLVVLDRFEAALDEDGKLLEPTLGKWISMSLGRRGGPRWIIAGRPEIQGAVRELWRANIRHGRERRLEGLDEEASEELLRALLPHDERELGSEDLRQMAARCACVPKALEHVAGIFQRDPTAQWRDLMARDDLFVTSPGDKDDTVEKKLATYRYHKLDGVSKTVFDALALLRFRSASETVAEFISAGDEKQVSADETRAVLEDHVRTYLVTKTAVPAGAHTVEKYFLHDLDVEHAYAHLREAFRIRPGRLEQLHDTAAQVFREVSELEQRAFEGDVSYPRWFRCESAGYHDSRAGWLYHLRRCGDETRTWRLLAKLYFDEYFWWGCYVPFPSASDLLKTWNSTMRSDYDRKWIAPMLRFDRLYPRTFAATMRGLLRAHQRGARPNWPEVEHALRSLLDEAVPRDGENMAEEERKDLDQLCAILQNYLGDSFHARIRDPNGAEMRRLAEEAYLKAAELFPLRNERGWAHYYLADFHYDCAMQDRELNDECSREGLVKRALREVVECRGLVFDDVFGEGTRPRPEKTTTFWDVRDQADDMNHELLANSERLLGDLDWAADETAGAFRHYLGAVFYAAAFNIHPHPPDDYTQSLYQEMTTRAAARLVELRRRKREREAVEGERILSEFQVNWPGSAPADWEMQDAEADDPGKEIESSRNRIFPSPPRKPTDWHNENAPYVEDLRGLIGVLGTEIVLEPGYVPAGTGGSP
jgi:hypothetical protein